MSTTEYFLRGARQLEPCSHIVKVVTRNGSEIFRRCSLTAGQMSAIESRLMELQHVGEIRSYLLASANDATFPELTQWLYDLAIHPAQPELLNVQVGTLFSGGAL